MHTSDRPRRRERKKTNGYALAGTNLERAGDHNQRVTLQAIRLNGPITRLDLVKLTGLTTPAIANITNRLLNEGLIVETGRMRGRRGQPAIRLAINPTGRYSIGVNIDRDHVTVLALDLAGNVRATAKQEVEFALPEAVAAFVRKSIGKMFSAKEVPRDRVVGIGVAYPDDLGRVNLPHRPSSYGVWDTVDLTKLFGDMFGLPVFIENDAAAAAISELQFGYGQRSPTFFYILISAALGGGLVIDGHYFRGVDGRSAEIGFLPLRSPRQDAHSLQEVVSLSALYERLAAAGHPVSDPNQLATLPNAAKDVIEQWIAESASHLVEPIVAISCLVNPAAVLVGGRLSAEYVDRLAERVNALVRQRARELPSVAPVLRAAIACTAPAVGAAILPFMDRLFPSGTVLKLRE